MDSKLLTSILVGSSIPLLLTYIIIMAFVLKTSLIAGGIMMLALAIPLLIIIGILIGWGFYDQIS